MINRIIKILLVLFLLVVLAIILFKKEENTEIKKCGVYIEGKFYELHYCENELKDIKMNFECKDLKKRIRDYNLTIILFDPLGDAYYSIALIELFSRLNVSRILACYKYHPKCRIVINETSPKYFYIILIESNESKIVLNENILKIYGKRENIIKSVDEVLYCLYS